MPANIYMASRVKLNRVLHRDELFSFHHRDSMNELQHLLDFYYRYYRISCTKHL